jgi:hypothetical protein
LADAGGRDAELVQAVDGADRIELQRAVVVGGERLAGHEIEGEGLQARQRIGQRHDHALETELLRRQPHELAERHHVGAVEFVDLPHRGPRVQGAAHGLDDVADVDRGEARARLRQRQDGAELQQFGEAAEEAVADAEDHRGFEDRPIQAAGFHRGLGLAARLEVVAVAAAGVERAHLQQPRHARELAGGDDELGQRHVGAVEAAAVVARFVEDADEVDDGVGTGEARLQQFGVVDVAGHHAGAGRQQAHEMRMRIAREHGELVAFLRESCEEDAADETGGAEQGDLHGRSFNGRWAWPWSRRRRAGWCRRTGAGRARRGLRGGR